MDDVNTTPAPATSGQTTERAARLQAFAAGHHDPAGAFTRLRRAARAEPAGPPLHTGNRGGRYYLNDDGRRVYVRKV